MSKDEDRIWYFAYGANMSTEVLVRRRGLRPLSSQAARLDGYRLVFDVRGLRPVEPAFANIVAAPEACVHGVLHRLSRRDLARLDRSESGDYEHLDTSAVGARTGEVAAIAYASKRRVASRRPSRRYIELLLRGAREFDLPGDYIRMLEEQPTAHVPLLSPLASGVIRAVLLARRHLRG